MKSLRQVGSLFVATVIVIATVSTYSPRVHAQNSGSGIQISPTRTDLNVNPGESKTIKITLKNVTKNAIIAKVSVNDFTSDNETGQPRILVNTTKHNEHSIADFLVGLKDVELNPGESKDVEFTISVPKGAAPGAYYSAIRYAAVPKSVNDSNGGEKIALTASVATLALVEVNGNLTQSIKFDKFDILSKGSSSNLFLSKVPDQASLKITNTGNTFTQPFGKVSVFKNNKEVYSYNVNDVDPKGNILPASSRTFKDKIKNVSGFGHYKATASIAYRQGGEVLNISQSFWVIPASVLIALGLGLVVLLAAIAYITLKIRSRSRKHNHS